MSQLLDSFRKKRGIRRYIGPKRVVTLLVLAAFIYWAWNCHNSGTLDPGIIGQYRDDHPAISVAMFILIYAVSVIASLPSLPLNLAAGFFWGGILGGVYATIGVTIGGMISFAAARCLMGQPLAAQFDNKVIGRVQRAFDRDGWKFVAFARMNPVIPTGLLNYVLGLTSMSGAVFLWVTFVFLLPPSIAVAYIGDTLKTFVVRQSEVGEIIRMILVVSAAITCLAAMKFASKLLKQERAANENNPAGNDAE